MKLLLVLSHPGFLRLYDEVIADLAGRGHHLHVGLENTRINAQTMSVLEGLGGGVTYAGRVPARKDAYAGFARALRRTADFAIYLHPHLARASGARERRGKLVAAPLRSLPGGRALRPGVTRFVLRAFLALERAIPSSAAAEDFVRAAAVDAVVVAPLVRDSGRQTDVVKAAQSLGVPTAVSVASWDNLTTKGLMRVQPDRVLVWNEAQAGELREFHAFPGERVIVTGAQPFDRWFGRTPRLHREAFSARVGLDPRAPWVLYTGSSPTIARPDREAAFILEWVRALRESPDPAVRDVRVLVRPHPLSLGPWREAHLDHLGVTVWPRERTNQAAEDTRADLFDSLYHSTAVVGVNTSAMIEAAIIGRPVHTLRVPGFARGQDQTAHFQHLLPENGGFLRVAYSMDEHLRQLAEAVANPTIADAANRRFVESFIRPWGLEHDCTPIVADAVEAVARTTPETEPPPVWAPLLRGVVGSLGTGGRVADARRRARKSGRRRARRLQRRVRRSRRETGALLRRSG
ncbi:MAG: hypothetical protein ACR2NV_10445 [Thermoleophilaceae bacterium]